jgi:hypothetical protein
MTRRRSWFYAKSHPNYLRFLPVLKNHVRSLLPNHDRCRICISANDFWHHRGIHHSQSTDPLYLQSMVNHSTHGAGPNRVIYGEDKVLHIAFIVVIRVRLKLPTEQLVWRKHSDIVLFKSLRILQRFYKLHPLNHEKYVILICQVLWVNHWWYINAGAGQGDITPTLGSQDARKNQEGWGRIIAIMFTPESIIEIHDTFGYHTMVNILVKLPCVKLKIGPNVVLGPRCV